MQCSSTFEFDFVVTDKFFQGFLQLEHGDFAGADGAHEAGLEGDEGVDKLLFGDDAARTARYAERAEAATPLFDPGCGHRMVHYSTYVDMYEVYRLIMTFEF